MLVKLSLLNYKRCENVLKPKLLLKLNKFLFFYWFSFAEIFEIFKIKGKFLNLFDFLFFFKQKLFTF